MLLNYLMITGFSIGKNLTLMEQKALFLIGLRIMTPKYMFVKVRIKN